MSSPAATDDDPATSQSSNQLCLPLGPLVIEAIAVAYRANMPVLLWGKHGIGKSKIFAQAAARLGVGFRWRDLSLLEPPDLLGLPRIDREIERTTSAPPAFLPGDGHGLLLLEELNRSPHAILGPAMQLILERELGDYVLPRGWLPCAAANPEGGDYHVTPLSPALRSRFAEIWCVPDVESWLAWAGENGVHHTIVEFVRRTPDAFSDPDANPRAWTQASQILQACDAEPAISDLVRLALLRGVLGNDKRAAALAAEHQQRERPLEPAEIIETYEGWRAAVLRWGEGGRTDLLRATMSLLIRHLDPLPVYQLLLQDHTQKDRVERFFMDLPGDMRAEVRVWLEVRGFRGLKVPSRAPRR